MGVKDAETDWSSFDRKLEWMGFAKGCDSEMLAAIGNFRNMQAEKKMLILGDMRELGKDSAEEHQRIVDYLEFQRRTTENKRRKCL